MTGRPETWVVVGAGSAGCVAANRLSADADRRVVLLEAGPVLTPDDVPPAIDGADFLAALALADRVETGLAATRVSDGPPFPYPRGRGLGGSSAVNAMVAVRGTEDRYRSWGWDDTEAAYGRMLLPEEPADDDELGAVDRALLAASGAARRVPLTRRDRRRITSAEAYLWPVLDRPGLTVRPDRAVERVLVERGAASGVVLRDGSTVSADRVVLAAGAIHSPAILFRSGLGGPSVGAGLQDHPSVTLTLRLRPGAADGAGLVIGSALDLEDGAIQVLPMNHLGADAPGLAALLVGLMRPVGPGGRVTVDRDGRPGVDLDLLVDDADADVLARGVHAVLRLLADDAFVEIVDDVVVDERGTTVTDRFGGDPDSTETRRAIREWVREAGGAYAHATGTCAMGRVVDEGGAVLGVDGVYVCDASVFPQIPDANTHLPTTMAAERLCRPGRLLP